jgi:hypothetical protein
LINISISGSDRVQGSGNPKSKIQKPNETPNSKFRAFGIFHFGFDLDFGICHLDFIKEVS